MLLTFIASLLIALLSGMGVGGGGLFVIYLSLFSSLPQIKIQGLNLLFFLFASGASLVVHLLKRNIVFSAVMILSLFGLAGAVIGSLIAPLVDGEILKKLFGMMLVISGIYSIYRQKGHK